MTTGDIIDGNAEGRAGQPNSAPNNRDHTWGWDEGKRHRTLAARVTNLEGGSAAVAAEEPKA